jgi:hypothetical protein
MIWQLGVISGQAGGPLDVGGEAESAPIAFGAWPDATVGLNGVLGRCTFMGGGQPSDVQVTSLAQAKSVAWALNLNGGDVTVSTTLVIDPKQNLAHFKQPIALEIVAQGTRGTASVNGENLQYVAGAGTGADSFTYRFTSAAGEVSNTATVSLNVVAAAGGALELLGAWPLSESGTAGTADIFDDTHANNNNATLAVPTWTVPTHVKNRRGIVAGSDHALEISNGGPAIPVIADYRKAAMSLVLYFEPMGELRGTQYWLESDEKYGREFLAYCDDGVTAGSFAIYRKRPAGPIASTSTTPSRSWLLGGYVRTGSGKQHFGGSHNGVAGTSLPPPSPWVTANTTAKRVVLTMGPAGAELWLDNTRVATMPSVTVGWAGLPVGQIHIGCSSNTGHANDRSPFWGRVDQIEIWQGQINPTTGLGSRPAAAQSVMWRDPTTAGTRVNINAYATVQEALDDAGDQGKWLWQDPTDPTEYLLSVGSRGEFHIDCPGIVGVRFKQRPELTLGESMMELNSVNSSWRPPANAFSPDGYRFIGCTFDGNIRARSWSAYQGHPGVTYHGLETDNADSDIKFGFQQNHCFLLRSEDPNNAFSVFADCCSFRDCIGDAFSITNQVTLRAESCRSYGAYRGTFVINNNDRVNVTVKRCETFMESRVEDTPWWNGSGLTDYEPYTSASVDLDRIRSQMYDVWAEGEFDDVSMKTLGGADAWLRFYNTHNLTSGFQHSPRENAAWEAPDYCEWFYSTIGYYRVGGTGVVTNGDVRTTSFPKEQLNGCPANGWLFDNTVFLMNGRETTMHDSGNTCPETSTTAPGEIARLSVSDLRATVRVLSLINCQVQTLRLHPSMVKANKRFLNFTSSMAGKELYIDGLILGASVATAAIAMSGGTVRHRGIVHGDGTTNIPSIITGASTYTPI